MLEEVWQEHPTTPEKDIRSALAAFLLGAGDVDKTVASLSGGQRARLLMTKLAMDHDNFLILDEPTNHLDINSKEVLEQALESFDGTVLFVSHDRYFINDLADRLVVLSPAGSETILGNWDYYQEKQNEDEPTDGADHLGVFGTSTAQKQTTNSQGAADYAAAKADQKAQRKLQRRVDAAEKAIEELEAQKQTILDAMALPENATAAIKLQDMQKDVDALDAQLADAEAEWEAAGMALEDNE